MKPTDQTMKPTDQTSQNGDRINSEAEEVATMLRLNPQNVPPEESDEDRELGDWIMERLDLDKSWRRKATPEDPPADRSE